MTSTMSTFRSWVSETLPKSLQRRKRLRKLRSLWLRSFPWRSLRLEPSQPLNNQLWNLRLRQNPRPQLQIRLNLRLRGFRSTDTISSKLKGARRKKERLR